MIRVVAPSTRTAAEPAAMDTVLPAAFLIGFVMDTLAASAPPESRTGMPPMTVHGHSVLLT